jgi:hypothetical protein
MMKRKAADPRVGGVGVTLMLDRATLRRLRNP